MNRGGYVPCLLAVLTVSTLLYTRSYFGAQHSSGTNLVVKANNTMEQALQQDTFLGYLRFLDEHKIIGDRSIEWYLANRHHKGHQTPLETQSDSSETIDDVE